MKYLGIKFHQGSRRLPVDELQRGFADCLVNGGATQRRESLVGDDAVALQILNEQPVAGAFENGLSNALLLASRAARAMRFPRNDPATEQLKESTTKIAAVSNCFSAMPAAISRITRGKIRLRRVPRPSFQKGGLRHSSVTMFVPSQSCTPNSQPIGLRREREHSKPGPRENRCAGFVWIAK